MWVSFRVQRHSITPTIPARTKWHPHWCFLVFSIVPSQYNTRWAWKDTNESVILCPALFRNTIHAKYKRHPHWCHFVFSVFRMPSNMLAHPCWCAFVFGIFLTPSHTCWTWKNTIVGVLSSSATFIPLPHMLSTKKHHRWCLFVFIILYHTHWA